MKAVINTASRGLKLSQLAYAKLIELGIPTMEYMPRPDRFCIFDRGANLADRYFTVGWDCLHIRHSTSLVRVVKELGSLSYLENAKLKIIGIPDGYDYEVIEDGDGEAILSCNRTWRGSRTTKQE